MRERTNTELLNWNPKTGDILGPIERQRRFVLQQHVQQKACPNCATPLNVMEACGETVDGFKLDGSHPDDSYRCPECQRGLRYVLPMIGGWHWALIPIDLKKG